MALVVLLHILLYFSASNGSRSKLKKDVKLRTIQANHFGAVAINAEHAGITALSDESMAQKSAPSSSNERSGIFTPSLCVVGFILLSCFVRCCCSSFSASSESSLPTKMARSPHAETVITLIMKRMSGEQIAIVKARPFWYAVELERELLAHLDPTEHVHSILYEVDSCEQQITRLHRIDRIGVKDHAELKVILLSDSSLPSGVSLFSYSKRMIAGPSGAHKIAKLWLHEDQSAHLECGEFLDIGRANTRYLSGALDEDARLRLKHEYHFIEASIEESVTKQRIINVYLPILGAVVLQEEIPDAVFDVSQTSAYVGWISLFKCGEMVVKINKRTSEGASFEAIHLRFEVRPKNLLPDGSINISCTSKHDFENWHEDDYPQSFVAALKGLLGSRTLALVEFPFIGTLDLLERPFWSEATGVGE